jgi:hypothetical protein
MQIDAFVRQGYEKNQDMVSSHCYSFDFCRVIYTIIDTPIFFDLSTTLWLAGCADLPDINRNTILVGTDSQNQR